jgi:hypothetical protein
VNGEKLNVLTNMANVFNSFFITVTEKFSIQYKEKEAAILIPTDSLPGNFPSIKINPITEVGIKSIIRSLYINLKKTGFDGITVKI